MYLFSYLHILCRFVGSLSGENLEKIVIKLLVNIALVLKLTKMVWAVAS